ncbi:hypothetical protein E2C01_066561 [Portunus trituberculatus]|uniref:Uncharacterized protein n=1 Tax=Portunus trituberculatus TaxID=210409 RepID=A0A5B7HQ42_PORTR|nr:hypothetical protein [Portunus trituberculatus]
MKQEGRFIQPLSGHYRIQVGKTPSLCGNSRCLYIACRYTDALEHVKATPPRQIEQAGNLSCELLPQLLFMGAPLRDGTSLQPRLLHSARLHRTRLAAALSVLSAEMVSVGGYSPTKHASPSANSNQTRQAATRFSKQAVAQHAGTALPRSPCSLAQHHQAFSGPMK